jgi:hypothetical protein
MVSPSGEWFCSQIHTAIERGKGYNVRTDLILWVSNLKDPPSLVVQNVDFGVHKID